MKSTNTGGTRWCNALQYYTTPISIHLQHNRHRPRAHETPKKFAFNVYTAPLAHFSGVVLCKCLHMCCSFRWLSRVKNVIRVQ